MTDDLPDTPGLVLVVDDDEANLDMLSRRLRRKGYEVDLAHDGEQAIARVGQRDYDVVLLDVMMPGLDGFQVLEILRQSHPATDLPVIMATAKGESEDVVRALGLGANDYVTKPLDFPVVLARMEGQLSLKRAVFRVRQLERSLAERNRDLEAANARLTQANGRMSRDLKAAAKVQGSFLPHGTPLMPGLAFAWAFRPCDELAGDGLNVIPLGLGRAALYVFDVSGHGVASAMLSVSLSRRLSVPSDASSILMAGAGPQAPGAVAAHLDRLFPFDSATEQYATLAYGVIDAASGVFRYTSAGHPGPAYLPVVGEPAILDGTGWPIGLAEGDYQEHTVRLAPGDRLFLYSDGVPEAMDPDGRAFGLPRLLDTLAEGRGLPLEECVTTLRAAVEQWCGAARVGDDVSILAVEAAVGGSA